MGSLLLVIFTLAVILWIAIDIEKGGFGDSLGSMTAWPFYAKKVMSPVEQVLYFRLVRALPEHVVLAQVQLSRVLGVRKGSKFAEWNNRINRMSVDFVVCAKDASILAVIELDDATHLKPARKIADAKKDRALQAANVRIHRWQAKDLPDLKTIKQTFGESSELVDQEPAGAYFSVE